MSESVPQPCVETDALLTDIACGEIEAPPAARAHLEGCARCRAELDALTRTARMAAKLTLREPSSQLDRRILAMADAHLARTGSGAARARPQVHARPTRARRWVTAFTAFASVAAAAAVTIVLVRHGGAPAVDRNPSSPAAVAPSRTPASPEKATSFPPAVPSTVTARPPAGAGAETALQEDQMPSTAHVQLEQAPAGAVAVERAKSTPVDLPAERQDAGKRKKASPLTVGSHRSRALAALPKTVAVGAPAEATAARAAPPEPPRAPPGAFEEGVAGDRKPPSNVDLGGVASATAEPTPFAQASAPAPLAAPAPTAAPEAVRALAFESRSAAGASARDEQERSRLTTAKKLLDQGSYPAALAAFRALAKDTTTSRAGREEALIGEVDALVAQRRFDEAERVARSLVDLFPARADVLNRVRAERARAQAPPAAAATATAPASP